MIRIYTLADPRDNQVFYVGASRGTEKEIISRHLCFPTGIRVQLRIAQLKPIVDFIEEADGPLRAAALECYWIWQFRSWGFSLENKRLVSGYTGSSRTMYSAYWYRILRESRKPNISDVNVQ